VKLAAGVALSGSACQCEAALGSYGSVFWSRSRSNSGIGDDTVSERGVISAEVDRRGRSAGGGVPRGVRWPWRDIKEARDAAHYRAGAISAEVVPFHNSRAVPVSSAPS